ncbi:MAG: glycosyltransferase [Lachnospiraceae bacterium]|nr:glycosyltransferase [Lachnospiraceae bacterium]
MKLQLTISLLASRQIHSVRKCLNSLIPILIAIPSELIIVDTSEDDQIRQLLLQYTPHVIPFHWCNDFSKARNAGIQIAQGEWFLFIDDDEWFENPREIITFFSSGEYLQYNSARYVVRNYTDWTGLNYVDASLNRMARLTPETKFFNPIHESLSPFAEPIKMLSSYVHHYGYAGKVLDSKTDRNIPLLKKELQESEPTIHNYLQLAQEYMSTHDFKKAEMCAKKCLDIEYPRDDLGKSWCIAYLPYMIYNQKEYQRAWKTGKEMLRHPQCSELSSLRIYIDLVAICDDLGNHEKDIIVYIKAYHQYLCQMDAHPELWAKQTVGILGEQHIRNTKDFLYFLGFKAAIQVEDSKSAFFFLQCLPWKNEGIKKLYPNFFSILKDEKNKKFFLNLSEKLDISEPLIFMIKSIAAWENKNLERSQKYFNLSVNSHDIHILMEAALLSYKSQGKISLAPVLYHADMSQLENISLYLTGNIETDNFSHWINLTKSYLYDFPIQSLHLLISFQAKRLIEGVLDIEDNVLFQEIKHYCQWVTAHTNSVYKENFLFSYNENYLPPNYRFALQMEKVFEDLEKADYPQVLQKLRKTIYIYKPFCGVIRRMLSIISDEINQPEQANPEFLALGAQVKNIVGSLIQEGRYDDALPFIQQLSTLLPKDLEVVRLRQELWSQMENDTE